MKWLGMAKLRVIDIVYRLAALIDEVRAGNFKTYPSALSGSRGKGSFIII